MIVVYTLPNAKDTTSTVVYAGVLLVINTSQLASHIILSTTLPMYH